MAMSIQPSESVNKVFETKDLISCIFNHLPYNKKPLLAKVNKLMREAFKEHMMQQKPAALFNIRFRKILAIGITQKNYSEVSRAIFAKTMPNYSFICYQNPTNGRNEAMVKREGNQFGVIDNLNDLAKGYDDYRIIQSSTIETLLNVVSRPEHVEIPTLSPQERGIFSGFDFIRQFEQTPNFHPFNDIRSNFYPDFWKAHRPENGWRHCKVIYPSIYPDSAALRQGQDDAYCALTGIRMTNP